MLIVVVLLMSIMCCAIIDDHDKNLLGICKIRKIVQCWLFILHSRAWQRLAMLVVACCLPILIVCSTAFALGCEYSYERNRALLVYMHCLRTMCKCVARLGGALLMCSYSSQQPVSLLDWLIPVLS